MDAIKELERTIKELHRQYDQAKRKETPADGWTQADRSPGIDQLANEIGAAEAELKAMKANMIPPGHKVIAAPSKSIQIRVKVTLLDRIENRARKEGRSRSNMITVAIKYYLENNK